MSNGLTRKNLKADRERTPNPVRRTRKELGGIVAGVASSAGMVGIEVKAYQSRFLIYKQNASSFRHTI